MCTSSAYKKPFETIWNQCDWNYIYLCCFLMLSYQSPLYRILLHLTALPQSHGSGLVTFIQFICFPNSCCSISRAMNYDALESGIMFILHAQIKYEIAHVLHSSLSTHALLNICCVAFSLKFLLKIKFPTKINYKSLTLCMENRLEVIIWWLEWGTVAELCHHLMFYKIPIAILGSTQCQLNVKHYICHYW